MRSYHRAPPSKAVWDADLQAQGRKARAAEQRKKRHSHSRAVCASKQVPSSPKVSESRGRPIESFLPTSIVEQAKEEHKLRDELLTMHIIYGLSCKSKKP